MGHPMRLELTLAGLLVKLANHYTTRGAHGILDSCMNVNVTHKMTYRSVMSISAVYR